jgi:CRISPR-associated endonuclease/helicase Cas3
MKKQDKLAFIEQLLLSHPAGLTRAEIAGKMGIHRSTAGRCIDDLTRLVPLLEDGNRLVIDKSRYLNNVRLTLHETFCLYLSARLLALTFNRYSPHVYSGMNKLAEALKVSSPLLGGFIAVSASHFLEGATEGWKDYTEILEKLTQAWSENRKAVILYRSKTANEPHKYTVAVYFMEPYPAGKTIYLFARTDEDGILRTFRTDRVSAVELTKESYAIPDDFDYRGLFANGWGIWDTHGKKEEILLRFSHGAAERVRETVWHKSQKLAEDEAGRLLFRACVTEPLEMVPWIRGWGSDCEVLAPEELREFMREEADRMRKLYE